MMNKIKYIIPFFFFAFIFLVNFNAVDAQTSCFSGSDCGNEWAGSCNAGNNYNDYTLGGCSSSETNNGNGTCNLVYTCTSMVFQGERFSNSVCNNGTCAYQSFGGFCQTVIPLLTPYYRQSPSYSCGSSGPGGQPICNNNGICDNNENYVSCPVGPTTENCVPPPPSNFTISVSPTTRSIYNGDTTSYTITVTPINNGALGEYTFTTPIIGCPSGATCTYVGGNPVEMTYDTTTAGVDYAVPFTKQVNIVATSSVPSTNTLNFAVTHNNTAATAAVDATLYINANLVPTVDIKGWGNTVPSNAPVDGPITMNYNTSGGLVWTSTNATNCIISRNGSSLGNFPVNSSAGVGPLVSSQTHSIICTNNSGGTSNNDSFTHNVNGTVSGNLLPATETCTIPAGSSSCTINFTWTTTNPITTSVVTSNINNAGAPSSNFTVANGNNSTGPTPFTIPGSTTTRGFWLYNNAQLLDFEDVSAVCENGSSWSNTTNTCATSPITIQLSAQYPSINNWTTVSDNTINWVITGNPTSCTATGNGPAATSWTTNGTTAVNNSLLTTSTSDDRQSQSPYQDPGAGTATYTYKLTCTKAGTPDMSDTITVTVSKNSTCTPVNFVYGEVSPATVPQGGAYTLSCDYGVITGYLNISAGSGSCTWGGWGGSGTRGIFNCTAGATAGTFPNSCGITYEATTYPYCSRVDAINDITVTAPPPPPPVPTVTISTSNEDTVAPGGATVTWSATNNPDNCTATGGYGTTWSGTKGASGSVDVSGYPAGSYTFWMYCTNSAGNGPTNGAFLTVNPAVVNSYEIRVATAGQGNVARDPAGTNCFVIDPKCAAHPQGNIVTFTATPASAKYIFTGWGGLCTSIARKTDGTPNTCPVTVPINGGTVYAYFAVNPNYKEF